MTLSNKILIFVASLPLIVGNVACSRVSAGMVGIQSTVTGSDKGLKAVSIGPDWVFHNPFTSSVTEYPIYMQTAVWTHNKDEGHPIDESITFTAKEQFQVAADISLAYTLAPEHAAEFYLKFRLDDIDKFTHGFLRNMAREKFDNVAGKYPIESIMGDNAQFLAETKAELQKELTPYGVKLEQFGFIGSPRPPQTIIDSINAKVQATQLAMQKQNEVVQATADAAKQVAQAKGNAEATILNADAQAQANRKLSDSLTPNLVQYRMIDKWDGKLPEVQSGNGGLMLQLPGK